MRRFLSFIILFVFIGNFFIHTEEQKKQLSLKEAIFFALKNNLDLQIEMTNTDYFWNSLKINESIFVPTFNVDFTNSETNRPSTGVLSGAEIDKMKNLSLTLRLDQKLALGGNLSVQVENSKRESSSRFWNPNPILSSQLTFSLSQPLLKGFGTFATKKDIYIANNEYKKNRHQLRDQIINLVNNVENAYWNLVYAHQSLEATKMGLKQAKDLLRENEIKVRVGSAAKIEILEAQTSVANYESQVIQSEQNVQTAEETLKKILNMVQRVEPIEPLDKPDIKTISIDFNKFLHEALNNRPDIERARLDLKNYNILVKYARNQMLPDLQLTASYYTTGQGGDQLIYEGNPLFGPSILVGSIEKDIWESMKDVISNLYRNYSIGLSLSIPLSFSREKAQLAQAKINLKRALLTLKNIENNIYSEVKEVLKELEARTKLVRANEIALKLNEQKLMAEKKKLAVGLSTNFYVINAQNEYLRALTNELRAKIDYNLTLAKINKTLARTFEANNIKFKDFVKK